MWMRETRTRLFIQMELEAQRDELDWLIISYLCAVNDNTLEYCAPMYLPVTPGYHTKLGKRAQMAAKGIIPPALEMILETRHPLPAQHQSQPVLPPSEIQPYPSPLPCARPRIYIEEDEIERGARARWMKSNFLGRSWPWILPY